MPAVDTVLLPLCVGLTLLGVIATGVAWRRGNKGRVLQGAALALAPVALYFSGLLRLLWNGIVAVGNWVSQVVLSPTVWFGLSLLGVCVVLWVVGAFVARRFGGSPRTTKVDQSGATGSVPARPSSAKGIGQGKTSQGKTSQGKQVAKPPVDDDMAEIEALLKARGID